jgi:hypothetical protein
MTPYDVDDPTTDEDSARNFKLTIPTLMWHKKSGGTIGQTFYVDPPNKPGICVPYFIKSTKNEDMNQPGIRFFNLWDTNENSKGKLNRVGRVFPDNQIVVIDDDELVAALSYKSNRNWTLPAPEVSLITPNIFDTDTSDDVGILSGDGKTLWVTYRLDSTGFTNSLHCNYYQNIIGPDTGCTISYNPEFIAQGDIVKGFENPDMILVGTREESLKIKMREIYGKMAKNNPIFCFMTPLEAELVKISLNGFVTTKISFANMISDLCDQLGADKTTVLRAVGSDTRIGRKYFNPGLSFGGPCFPRDTKALKQLMDQNNIPSNILKSTTEYNEEHNRRYAEYLASDNPVLKEAAKVSTGAIEEATGYLFTNVCYKEGSKIPIIEESAKLKIAENLVKKYKKHVTIMDTPEIIREVQKEYGSLFVYKIDQ